MLCCFRQLIESTGAILVMLPAYSYDLNPIEHASSKVKARLIRNRTLARRHPRLALYKAMMSVNTDDAVVYFRHCGYEVLELPQGLSF